LLDSTAWSTAPGRRARPPEPTAPTGPHSSRTTWCGPTFGRAGVPSSRQRFQAQWHITWITHADNVRPAQDHLLPPMDRGFSALVETSTPRGLLRFDLVVALGEFDAVPRSTRTPGENHWPSCYTGGPGRRRRARSEAVFRRQRPLRRLTPLPIPSRPPDLAAPVFLRSASIPPLNPRWCRTSL